MRLLSLLYLVVTVNTVMAQDLKDEEVVRNADAALNRWISENNSEKAAEFYADRFILTTSSGNVKRKSDMLGQIASPDLRLEINKTEDIAVFVEGNTAVLTGKLHQKGSYKGKTFDVVLLVTDTWIRTAEGWKLLAGHASPHLKTPVQ
jgi:ketosteroid isomerase-like protein